MAQDPRETIRKLQQTLQQRTRGGFGGSGGLPGGAQLRPVAALILLGLGGYILSNSIFNGRNMQLARNRAEMMANRGEQLMVATELSSILE